MKPTSEPRNYTLILNNRNSSDAIIASDEISGYEQSPINGFDGEIYTMFIATLGVIIQMASLILQLRSIKNEECGIDNNADDEIKITVLTPNGNEYRNVPLNKVSELISVLRNRDEKSL